MRAYEGVVDQIDQNKRRNIEGQISLFALVEDAPPAYDIPKTEEDSVSELLAMEKETVGFVIFPAIRWTRRQGCRCKAPVDSSDRY